MFLNATSRPRRASCYPRRVPSAPAPLDASNADFIQSGLAIDAASFEAGHIPVLARVLACRVAPDRGRVTVFLTAPRNRRFLDAVAASGAIAVVFCHPRTLQTLQLKGIDAAVAAGSAADGAYVAAAVDAFVDKVVPLGFAAGLARRELQVAPGTLRAITFTIAAAFVQTPGPAAGSRM
jgi:hypothetical protein